MSQRVECSLNDLRDMGSIAGCVIPKTLKVVIDTSLLSTQQYKLRIKGTVEQSREKCSAPPTPQCSSYWNGSLLVALDYGRQLSFFFTLTQRYDPIKWTRSDGSDSAFPKAPPVLEPHHQTAQCHIQDTHWRVLTLCIEAFGVLYIPCWLGNTQI